MLTRRAILWSVTFLAIGICITAILRLAQPDLDLVIREGFVVDGSGAPPFRADVGIRHGRIQAIGDLGGRRSRRVLLARNRIVAPGFIDTQGQSGASLLADGRAESHLRQGITTEIIGEADTPALLPIRSERFDAQLQFVRFLSALDSKGTSLNVGSLVPANTVRRMVLDMAGRSASDADLQSMGAIVAGAMRGGALGLSAALAYPPALFMTTPELSALVKEAGRAGGFYATHVRSETGGLEDAVAEAIRIGESAQVPVVIFHLKIAARSKWGTMARIGTLIEEARRKGVRVSATMYPYTSSATSLGAILPEWVFEGGNSMMLSRLRESDERRRIKAYLAASADNPDTLIGTAGYAGVRISAVRDASQKSIVGTTLAEVATARGHDPLDTLLDLLLSNEGRVGALYNVMSEEDVKTALMFPWTTIGSDSAASQDEACTMAHPRAFGTFPRVLGRYVREQQVLTLPAAINKMTGLAASQMGIRERGLIREGFFADVVVFDPVTIKDNATYSSPCQYPDGIDYVIVNGVVTLDKGRHTGAKAGRALIGPGFRARER
jgi:N-acyl-D-amino-acid deacylase